jgi:hypothetical protein
MKSSLRSNLPFVIVLAAIVVGCRTEYLNNGGAENPEEGGMTTDPDLDISGYFVEGSHDVEGGGPPPTKTEEEDEGEETQSHFRAIQLDPNQEDTAGAKFIRAVDMNDDGLMDIVSGHTQSQPVQIHLQRRDGDNISFQTVTIGGTAPIGVIGGIDVADMDEDGAIDVVVLVKHTGELAYCLDGKSDNEAFTGVIIILFAPAPGEDITDGDAWEQVALLNSYSVQNSRWGRASSGMRAIDFPEEGGYTDIAVGDIDGANGPDIVVTSNVAAPDCNSGKNVVELWLNPGAGARDGTHHTLPAGTVDFPSPPTFWYPVWLASDAPIVRACELMDVDNDGDLDIISAYSDSYSQNVRWHRNPLVEAGADAITEGVPDDQGVQAWVAGRWEKRPIGTVDGDIGAIVLGDMDNDGYDDVFVRAFQASTAMWFRRPTVDTSVEPTFPPGEGEGEDHTPLPDRFNFPWQVYAMDVYYPYRPVGLGVGDLTNDGKNDATVSVGGALYWYDSTLAASVFDEWGRDFVLDDTKANGTTDDPTDLDFLDDGTIIYTLIVVDLDGDGVNDIVATFDRRVDGGLADDSIIWFRNTLFDEEEAVEEE